MATAQEKYNAPFPVRLRELIKSKKTTITALAHELKISRQAVSQYADGSTQPNLERLVEIAKYLNVSTDWLLGLTDESSTDVDAQRVSRITGLSANAVEKLSKIKNKHPQIDVINFLIVNYKLIRMITNYFSDFTIGKYKEKPYKYIPLKAGSLYDYRNDVHFAASIRALQKSCDEFKDKYKDDDGFITQTLYSFLFKHADIDKCRFIVDYDELIPQLDDFVPDEDDIEAVSAWYEESMDERAAEYDDFQKELEERNDAILNFLDAYSKGGVHQWLTSNPAATNPASSSATACASTVAGARTGGS